MHDYPRRSLKPLPTLHEPNALFGKLPHAPRGVIPQQATLDQSVTSPMGRMSPARGAGAE